MTRELVDQLIRDYGFSSAELEPLSGGQNFVYLHRRGEEKSIIRITGGRHRSAQQVEAELQWIDRLVGRGIKACPALPAADGRKFRAIEHEGATYVAACFRHAPGMQARRELADEAVFEGIGRLTGAMHREAERATVEGTTFYRPHWKESRLLNEDFEQCRNAISLGFRAGVRRLIESLHEFNQASGTYGLIHADVNFDNLYDDCGELTIFDFDNCEYGYFVQDLATILYDSIYCKVLDRFADEGLTRRMKPLWQALLKGYFETGPLREIDLRQLKSLFLIREAIIYVHYHRVLNVATMDESFHRGLQVIRRNVEDQAH